MKVYCNINANGRLLGVFSTSDMATNDWKALGHDIRFLPSPEGTVYVLNGNGELMGMIWGESVQIEAKAPYEVALKIGQEFVDAVAALETLADHASEMYPHFESERGQRDIANARAALVRLKA